MSGPTPYDKTHDPLTDELLPMLQAACNAKASAYFAANGIADAVAVQTVQHHPIAMKVAASEGEWPVLAVWISRSQRKYTTLVHLDDYATLTFQYLSPSVSFEDLSSRWNVLHLVWRAITDTLRDGFSAAWQGGARTLDASGLVRVDIDTAKYDAIAAPTGGDYAFPMFSATLDVVWRDVDNWRFGTTTAVPFGYVRANLFQESDPATGVDPDVVVQVDGSTINALIEAAET